MCVVDDVQCIVLGVVVALLRQRLKLVAIGRIVESVHADIDVAVVGSRAAWECHSDGITGYLVVVKYRVVAGKYTLCHVWVVYIGNQGPLVQINGALGQIVTLKIDGRVVRIEVD